jgi:simple sugar transport system permease protein
MSSEARYLIRLAAFAVTILLLFCILSPSGFLSTANLSSMAYQLPEFAMLALAIHPTMLTGGIDLSVVSVANMSAIIAALTMRSLPPQYILVAMFLAVLVGCTAGAINGLLVASGLPAILATLGTMQFFAGIAVVLAYSTGDSGASVTGIPPIYSNILNGSVFGIPTPLIAFLLTVLVIYVVTARTPLGKQMRLFGTNSRAAVFAGIPTYRVVVTTYMLSGIIASCAGLVILARANSANADYGTSYLLLSVLINILAGVNPNGGSGTVFGLILAVLSLQFISSGLNIMAVNVFARDLTYGALLVTVMVVNRLQGKIHSTRPRT